MVKKLIFFAVLTGVTGIISCETDELSCQRVNSEIITDQKSLSGFDGIVFSAVGDVIITQGTDYSFSVKGPRNVVEALTTEIVGTDLLISSSSCFNGFTDENQMVLHITAPVVRSVELIGSGDISSTNTLIADYLNVSLYGVGTVSVDTEVDSLHTEIPGTGIVKITGWAPLHYVINASDGELQAFGLVTGTTNIVQRGKGNSKIYVTKFLNAELGGTGNIYYKGTPEIQSDVTGTGELIPSN